MLVGTGAWHAPVRSCFFLAEGMDDSSLGKEILLKIISDEVVFCHPIIPKGAPF